MIIQWVFRGMRNINSSQAKDILQNGIECNWVRNSSGVFPNESDILDRLTDIELNWHQNKFSYIFPKTKRIYSELTPFISTTAGTVERSSFYRKNVFHPAWLTALEFATDKGRQDGWLFYCYLFVIGKKSVGIRQFSEELRELNIYQGFSPYHPEGEIASKILIPSVQIKCAFFYPKAEFKKAISLRKMPKETLIVNNDRFVSPDLINNVRDVIY